MKRVGLACLALLCWPSAGAAQYAPPASIQYVGIPTANFDFVASAQQTPMWCWAASIEMVLRYYGVQITQQDIVRQTYRVPPGAPLPPFGGSVPIITNNLNYSGVDDAGRPFTVRAKVTSNSLPDMTYLQSLSNQRPLVVAYGPNLNSGHVVVLTAASYVPTPAGNRIYTLVFRDPFPTPQHIQTRGRVEYLNYAPPNQGGMPAPIQAVWFVDVSQP